MQTNEMLQSKTIAFLRFPLIVGVVLIHSTLADVVINGTLMVDVAAYPFFRSFSYLFSEVFSRIAVPLFFFISGFLFFHRPDGFDGRTYAQKLKKRARTILVPYVCWNLLVILFYLFAESLFPELLSGRNKPVAGYSVADWFWAFWNTQHINPGVGGAYPINYPLWFIRDLMVVMLFSPLVYFVVKRMKHYAVIVLGLLWVTGCWSDAPGFSSDAFFFFSAGAYFGIHKKSFLMRKPVPPLAAVYSLFAIVQLVFRGEEWTKYVARVGILLGMTLAIGLAAKCLDKGTWRVDAFLSESSFFIYAYHALPLAFVIKFVFRLLHPQSELSLVLAYLFCPALAIGVGLGAYYLLKRLMPRFTAVLTGGR